MKHQSQDTQ